MQGVFQNLGNKKTQRFPVYKAVKGFDVFLRFSASKCTGQLVEITSRDNKEFLRITLLEVGPIRFSFNTYRGRGQLEFGMPKKGSFCDGKRHVLALNIYRGVVFYYVDRSSPARFYVSRLAAPFSSPDKIVLGRGLDGCVSGATVINRFSKTEEHRIMSSGECALRGKYVSDYNLVLKHFPLRLSLFYKEKNARGCGHKHLKQTHNLNYLL